MLQQVSLATGKLAPSVATVSVANPVVGILARGRSCWTSAGAGRAWHIALGIVGLALALGGAVLISIAGEAAKRVGRDEVDPTPADREPASPLPPASAADIDSPRPGA